MTKIKWIPQWENGSGWDLKDKDAPYYYEHISLEELTRMKEEQKNALYKIVTAIQYVGIPVHRNTYFVKGDKLFEFIVSFGELAENIVSIERVEKMPDVGKKLK